MVLSAWWMSFSFWLSIYHSWFPSKIGWIRWPWIWSHPMPSLAATLPVPVFPCLSWTFSFVVNQRSQRTSWICTFLCTLGGWIYLHIYVIYCNINYQYRYPKMCVWCLLSLNRIHVGTHVCLKYIVHYTAVNIFLYIISLSVCFKMLGVK